MVYQGVTESRFYMWRAVFAMAHVDGKVSAEEVSFAEDYLDKAPFSDEQRRVLTQDLTAQQKVGDMLAGVSDPSDQADFFQFSQMLAWADGDYNAQEKALLERVSDNQASSIDATAMVQKIREARKAAILRRALEDNAFVEQARDISGFANVLRFITPWVEVSDFEAPDDEMFKLWRAVFSLVHVDGEVSDEERDYVEGMMDVFHFSDEQRAMVSSDLQSPSDTVSLFKQISSVRHRRQFFILARTIIWCDGVLHDDERAAIEAVKDSLRDAVSDYESELRWIDRKPDVKVIGEGGSDEERMMQDVVRQMVDFYKESIG